MGKYLKIFGHFLNFGFVFVLWPSELGTDGVFTRIFQGHKSAHGGRRSDWILTMDSRGIVYWNHARDRPHDPPYECHLFRNLAIFFIA